MSFVRFESVSKSLGGRVVLDGINLRVEEGEKVGLIGRNGTGKTTIFRLITGEISPDRGVVERMRRVRIACLAQLPVLDVSETIFDRVMTSFQDLLALEQDLGALEQEIAAGRDGLLDRYSALQEDFTARGGYEFRTRAKQVLHGLGFRVEEFSLPVHALSGGQRTRLLLALVLIEDADLLLLDEPENHLDIAAQEWLENYLRDCPKAVVMISHDRRMLNNTVDRLIEVERGQVTAYSGNYEFYAGQKALLREQQQKAYEQQQEFVEKEQRWIERFRYKNTKARQVQSRINRLEKLERLDAPSAELRTARFQFGEVVRSGQWVIDARDLGMAYGDLRLYGGLTIQVTRGERVGVIGPNGSGKTTLLMHLAGRLDAAPAGTPSGQVTLGPKVTVGFYEQHHEGLVHANDVFTEIRMLRRDMTPEQVRSFLGRFLFTGDDVFKPLSALSGGELSRVAVAKLILGGANLLLLDEPTNHLDIASRESVEAALAEFPGTLVMVSHDRQLIDRLVDKLIVIENGAATVHLGNYSRYHWKHLQETSSPPPGSGDDAMAIRAKKKPTRDKTQEKEARKRQRQVEELERDIEAIEELVEGLEAQFAGLDPADYERGQALKAEYDGLKQDLQQLYAEWERLVESS